MKVISIVNHKGGVGKTTTAINFSAELANRGYKVLLIDFDTQGNLSKACGISGDIRPSLAEAMLQAIEGEIIDPKTYKTTIHENIDIVPCSLGMQDIMKRLEYAKDKERKLRAVIRVLKNENQNRKKDYGPWDYIILDCAPSIMLDFDNAILASDEILVVTNPDEFSISGMESLQKHYLSTKRCMEDGIGSSITGVLINAFDKRNNYSKEFCNLIKEAWGSTYVFRSVIPSSVRIKEAILEKKSVMEYDPNGQAADAYRNFVDEYMGEEKCCV